MQIASAYIVNHQAENDRHGDTAFLASSSSLDRVYKCADQNECLLIVFRRLTSNANK